MLKCCDFCDVLSVSEYVYASKMKKRTTRELTYLQSLGILGLHYIAQGILGGLQDEECVYLG